MNTPALLRGLLLPLPKGKLVMALVGFSEGAI